MEYRIEHDTMGEVKVPVDKYRGAQTQRSRDNFAPVLLMICFMFSLSLSSQSPVIKVQNEGVSINNNGQSLPRSGAVLDVSSNSEGVIFPQLTESQRDAILNPAPGLLVYNLDVNLYQYFNGAKWLNMGVIEPSIPTFISEWKTDNNGISNDNQITLPLVSSGAYDFNVEWGDGTENLIQNYNQPDITHTYVNAGTYQIKITGLCQGWAFDFGGDREKIIHISEWGVLQPTIKGSFNGCVNLDVTATDPLDLSQTNTLDSFFGVCTSLVFNESINSWNTSGISNFKSTFINCFLFNQPLSNWNTTQVTNMSSMFSGCHLFDQDLSSWVTSSLVNVASMFNTAKLYNQPMNSWNMEKVTDATAMFSKAYKFNQDLDQWITTNLQSVSQMFDRATEFNGKIDTWNVSNISVFFNFLVATSFNQSLDGWASTFSATNVKGMLFGNPFNQDISMLDFSNVTNADNMLKNCVAFDQDLSTLNVSSLSTAVDMFGGITQLSSTNYEALLIGWNNQLVNSNVEFGAGNSTYTLGGAAEAAKANLESIHGWTITDGGSL